MEDQVVNDSPHKWALEHLPSMTVLYFRPYGGDDLIAYATIQDVAGTLHWMPSRSWIGAHGAVEWEEGPVPTALEARKVSGMEEGGNG